MADEISALEAELYRCHGVKPLIAMDAKITVNLINKETGGNKTVTLDMGSSNPPRVAFNAYVAQHYPGVVHFLV